MVYRQLAASQRAEEGAVVAPLRKGNASRLRHVVAGFSEVARGGAPSRNEAGGHNEVESSDVWSAAHFVVISQPVLVAVLVGMQRESEGESERGEEAKLQPVTADVTLLFQGCRPLRSISDAHCQIDLERLVQRCPRCAPVRCQLVARRQRSSWQREAKGSESKRAAMAILRRGSSVLPCVMMTAMLVAKAR